MENLFQFEFKENEFNLTFEDHWKKFKLNFPSIKDDYMKNSSKEKEEKEKISESIKQYIKVNQLYFFNYSGRSNEWRF